MNLIRLGNRIVLKRSETVLNSEVLLHGEQALDFSFDFGGIAGGRVGRDVWFDMGEFFKEKRPVRITPHQK